MLKKKKANHFAANNNLDLMRQLGKQPLQRLWRYRATEEAAMGQKYAFL